LHCFASFSTRVLFNVPKSEGYPLHLLNSLHYRHRAP